MLATALVNDLDGIDFLLCQAPHRIPRPFWRISLDGRARPKPRVLGEERGCGVTAGSAKRWEAGCQQAGTSEFAAGKPRTRRMSSSESQTDLTVVTPAARKSLRRLGSSVSISAAIVTSSFAVQ
jgi:hypothetical protein